MPILAPIIGIISSAASAIGSITIGGIAIGKMILGTLLSIGLNLISSLLMKQKKPEKGFEIDLQIGGDVPRQVILGVRDTAGHLVYWNTYGDKNKYLQMVFALSDSYCANLNDRVIIDGAQKNLVEIAVTGTEHARFNIQDFAEKITVRWFNGSQSAADAELVANANPAGRWTENDVLTGICYVSVTVEYDEKLFSGIPQFRWIPHGSKLFDPRKAPEFGGTGTHVRGDPSTYEWTANPSLHLLNFLLGITNYQGARMVGLGVEPSELDINLFIAAANVSDEQVALDEGSEERFRANLIITSDVEARQAVETIVNTMAGFTVERSGQFGIIPAGARTPIDTITDMDLIRGVETSFSAKRSRAELANAVFGQYLDPFNLWQANSYAPILSNDLEAEDGERLGITLDMPAVWSHTQAQRVAKIRLREIRKQAQAAITLGFNKIWWQAGDWIVWNSERYGNRTYRITSREINPDDRTVSVTIDEISADVYDWTAGDDGGYVEPGTGGQPGTQIQTVADWRVSIHGEAQPSLKFEWDPPFDPTIDAVLIQYRIADVPDAGITNLTDSTPDDGIHVEPGVEPNKVYEARATIKTTPIRDTIWTEWVRTDQATGGIIATDVLDGVIDRDALNDVIRAIMDYAVGFGENTLSEWRDDVDARLEALGAAAATTAATNYDLIAINKVVSEHGFAGVSNSIKLLIAEDEALAEQYTTLSVRLDAAELNISGTATAVSGLTSRVTVAEGAITAQSSQITALESELVDANNAITGNATAISGLQTTVTMQGTIISSQSSQLTSLESRITNAEGVNAGQATAISGIETTVTSQGGQITALSNSVTTLSTTVAGHTAQITTVQTSINGIQVNYGLEGTIDGVTGGFYFTGAKKLDGTVTYDVIFSADRVIIGDLNNYIRNGGFDSGLTAWSTSGTVAVRTRAAIGSGWPFAFGATITGNGSLSSTSTIPVKNGEQYLVALTDLGSSLNVSVQVQTATGSLISCNNDEGNTQWTPVISGAPGRRQMGWLIPADGNLIVNIYRSTGAGNATIGGVKVLQKYGSTLIVDGSIITDKLAANSVSTEKLIVGGVTTDSLALSAASVVTANTNFASGTIPTAFTTYVSTSITMSHAGYLFISGTAALGFGSGGAGATMRLLLNGGQVWLVGGTDTTPQVQLTGSLAIAVGAGTHTVTLQLTAYSGQNPVTHERSTISVVGSKR